MRHKYADLIHAWEEGAEIEIFHCGQWAVVQHPTFSGSLEYRIKPEKKPDVVYHGILRKGDCVIESITYGTPNIRCTFDGETGELKSAEVIK